MFKMSEYTFVAGLITLGLALVCYVVYVLVGVRASRLQTAGGPTTQVGGFRIAMAPPAASVGRYATIMLWLSFAFLTASLIFRAISAGHGPFSNMYEFSVAFAWGIIGAYGWFEHRYHQRLVALVALPMAMFMLLYATTVPATIEPLVPALQNNLLLTVHVAVAIVAYGSFTIAFASALLYLIQPKGGRWGLPKPEILDEIGYRAVVVGFPFMTLVLILGALWADVAWGRYWGWDPKETATLLTWLIYGAYLHAHVMRGWRGSRSAWLLVLGFVATLFTYFGNLFFGGLHSYGGLG